jgi:hypothetical protein
MNKNTRAWKKLGFSNMPETTMGTGSQRKIVERNAEAVFKGSTCDTSLDNPKSKHNSRKKYKAENAQ